MDKQLEVEETVSMRLCGDIHAYDYGDFEMPKGAEIDTVSGRWGVYQITFTDWEKYPMMEVQCSQEIEGKFPEYVRISDDEGNDVWEESGVW